MTNEIGEFFAGHAEAPEAARAVANHLKRYWEPRMRAQMISYFEQRDGAGLTRARQKRRGADGGRQQAQPHAGAASRAPRHEPAARGGVDLRLAGVPHHHGVRDRFANHILPDKIHMVTSRFLVPQLRREYGGCAGNIRLTTWVCSGTLGFDGHRGRDFAPYREWMARAACPTITSR